MTSPSPELVEEIARVILNTFTEEVQRHSLSCWAEPIACAVLSSPTIAKALEWMTTECFECGGPLNGPFCRACNPLDSTPQATGLSAIAQSRDESKFDLNLIYEEAKAAVLFGEPCIEFSGDQIRTTATHRFFIAVSDIVDALSAARSAPPIERSEIGEAPVSQASDGDF